MESKEQSAPVRVLITGAQGFLGARLTQSLRQAEKKQKGGAVIALARSDMDLTNEDAVRRAVENAAPQLVFHCAAVSDTGLAEREPELSYAVNVRGTLHLAAACKDTGAKLVAMSSDQIYNGTLQSGPLAETAPVQPQTVYGRHKLLAEQQTLALLPQAVFLRLTWMYDLPKSPLRLNANLLCALCAAAQSGVPLHSPVHEQRGVTDVWQVVRALPRAACFAGGVYNFGSENTLCAYDTAVAAARAMGLPQETVQAEERRYAKQPRNLSMDCAKARSAGVDFPDTVAGIAAALAR
ncbi:MAG: sugar nucleotide-binding protein [Ruthenibacterium sp.]